MSSDIRKEAMAAADALLRALAKVDEIEAAGATAKSNLAATKAEHVEETARLERTRQAATAAEAEHARWSAATQKERTKVDAEIGQLQGRLEALRTEITGRRAESDNILAGIKALHARLKVG